MTVGNDLFPLDVGGILWLPEGGEAAEHALETVYDSERDA